VLFGNSKSLLPGMIILLQCDISWTGAEEGGTQFNDIACDLHSIINSAEYHKPRTLADR
jgi:hypothetical protein